MDILGHSREMLMRTIFLALNELNFKLVEKYIQLGYLPHFKQLFAEYGYAETVAENDGKLLEPWIQWVTIQTGKSYAQHQIFRLGDIVQRADLVQIYEVLEERGYRVGAVSPMNADNRLRHSPFFIPDPWTKTRVSGNRLIKKLAKTIAQVVNDNAQQKISLASLGYLWAGFLYYTARRDYGWYLKQGLKLKKEVATKALILDKLLSDIFIKEWRKSQPDFALLFLNGAAHLQHHYLFNSRAYTGNLRNPDWYCAANQDPILVIYQLYDEILARLLKLPQIRLMIATGLSQQPHIHLTYYWRLKNHAQFLHRIGIRDFIAVYPRMSRDFLIEFSSPMHATNAANLLMQARTLAGDPLFAVENRDSSLFVELIYPAEISVKLTVKIGQQIFSNFKQYVVLVALKNGEHNTQGYYVDTARLNPAKHLPLTQIYSEILKGF